MTLEHEIISLDATEIARLVRSRELSPVEVLDAHLRRIESTNPALNAIVTINERAQEEARQAEKALLRAESLGSLHGVPFTAKDSFDTAGLRSTRGSLLFAENVPVEDATAVARLRQAGGILIGKTNVPEFVLWAETDNRLFGPTVNPWAPTRTPGGSSGGEAAALAAGLSPLGLGSDLSGSIRLPAHYCGVVGLKPTHGRVPITGHWPETLQDYTHVGPMARSVRDVRLALHTMEGRDGRDWYAQVEHLESARRPLEELQVGWLAEDSFGPLDDDVASTVARAAEALTSSTRSVRRTSLASLERDYDLLTMDLYGAESGPFFDEMIGGRAHLLHDVLRNRLAREAPSLPDYLAARDAVTRLRVELMAQLSEYDVLLGPVVPVPAPIRGQQNLTVSGRQVRPRSVLRATLPFDLSGHPAASVPFGRNSNGLPIGVQVVGRRFADDTVLDVAEWLMEQCGQNPIAEPQVASMPDAVT